MKIRKEDYPAIAAMKLTGSTWKDIAAAYGLSVGHLKNLSKEILSVWDKERISVSGIARAIILTTALTAKSDKDRLRAAIYLIEIGEAEEKEQNKHHSVRSDKEIVAEIVATLKQAEERPSPCRLVPPKKVS